MSILCFLTISISSGILRYEVGELSLIIWTAPRVWETSSEVYTANVSRSNSRAEERILVAISPLEYVSYHRQLGQVEATCWLQAAALWV